MFNGNLAQEQLDVQRFYDLTEMKPRLSAHLHWNNHGRTHHAHGGLWVSADHYYDRADEVLARTESGTLEESNDLGLRERRISLFSVTSENDEVLVSLLGQRLAPSAHRENQAKKPDCSSPSGDEVDTNQTSQQRREGYHIATNARQAICQHSRRAAVVHARLPARTRPQRALCQRDHRRDWGRQNPRVRAQRCTVTDSAMERDFWLMSNTGVINTTVASE